MTGRERDRLMLMHEIEAKRLTVREAALRMGVSERQCKRIWRAFRERGDGGMVHGLRGQRSNAGKRMDGRKESALGLYREHYVGFGPKLASELLAERHELVVDHETLRRWLMEAKLWRAKREPKRQHRWRRERKLFRGEMVQLDGSLHDWFEGRAGSERCVLIVMVDDATGEVFARFHGRESSHAVMATLRDYGLRHGLPRALYADKASWARVNGASADEVEQRGARRPRTQLGRALDTLGVELIAAHSPQAKGRVERANGTLQDRLVKLLRLEGISDLAAANRYLDEVFLPAHNARFTVPAGRSADLHQPCPPEGELAAALSMHTTRKVGRDYCVSYNGQCLQLSGHDANRGLVGQDVVVHEHLDGQLILHARGRQLVYEPLPERPKHEPVKPTAAERVASHKPPRKPARTHPFNQPIGKARRRTDDDEAA